VGCHAPPMAKLLLSSFGKKGDSSYTTTGVAQGLDTIQVDIEDTAHLSRYFQVIEFDPAFSAGKNCISFNGSDLLKDGTEIKVQALDSEGNSLYLAAPRLNTTSSYVDIANYTVAIYIYQETINGAGKVFLVGTTNKNETVRWTGNISINNRNQNSSRVRFYKAPFMEVRPLLYPVIENITGSTITKQVTVSGSFYAYTQTQGGDTTFILKSVVAGNPNSLVASFNSQMQGSQIDLDYYNLYLLTTTGSNNSHIYPYPNYVIINQGAQAKIYKHIKMSTTITEVDSVSQVQVESVNLGQGGMTFPASFTSSFAQVEYIQQAVTQPMKAALVNKTLTDPGFTEVVVGVNAFTSSTIGQTVTLKYQQISLLGANVPPFNPAVKTTFNHVPVTGSTFTVLDVTGSHVLHVNPIIYTTYTYNGFSYVPHPYTASAITGSITVLSASNPYQGYVNASGTSSVMKKSYVDIIYRNLDTFSGFVARHKLYAKSNIYPGNFSLIDDTVLGPSELLVDPITVNKNFSTIGKFVNQDFINQYWFASSASLNLLYSDVPKLSNMIIRPTTGYSGSDGNSYVIVKAQAIGTVNDSNYYPYDSASFNQFSGVGYTSNFIFLQAGTLYQLSTDLIVNKNLGATSKVMFFFTSSIPEIIQEPSFTPQFGWKLGEIVVTDKVKTRIFPEAQKLSFTPKNDYYGTLVIVPVNCEASLANVSMLNYGDYGFSPQSAVVQIPFPLNIANEKWTLKSELFDSNYNLIYTIPSVVQTFDPTGASLFGNNIIGTGTSTGGTSTLNNLTVNNQIYLPGIGTPFNPHRFLAYNIPTHNPPLSGEGTLGYTPISDLSLVPTNNGGVVTTRDYINVTSEDSDGEHNGRAIVLRYSGSAPGPYGRRVYVETNGTKHTYS
jgi:hypothetical protein